MATLLTFGKHRNEILEATPDTYIKWLAAHRNVLSPEHRYISDIAKQILATHEQAKAHAEAVEQFKAQREARLAVKATEQIVRANQGNTHYNLNTSRAFSIWR